MLSQHNKNTHAFHIPSNSCYTHDTHKSYSLLSYSPVPRTHTHTRTHTTVWVALSVSLVHKWRAKIGRQQRGRIYSNYFDSRIRNRRALIRGRGMK